MCLIRVEVIWQNLFWNTYSDCFTVKTCESQVILTGQSHFLSLKSFSVYVNTFTEICFRVHVIFVVICNLLQWYIFVLSFQNMWCNTYCLSSFVVVCHFFVNVHDYHTLCFTTPHIDGLCYLLSSCDTTDLKHFELLFNLIYPIFASIRQEFASILRLVILLGCNLFRFWLGVIWKKRHPSYHS